MSFQAMAWAVKQKMQTNQKFLLIMLANYASNDEGDCYPSVDTLAKDTGLSRTSVQKCLKILAEKGFLEIKTRWENGRQLSNLYRLKQVWGEGLPETPRCQPDGRRGLTDTPPGASHVGPNLLEEPINQPITPKSPSKPPFDEKAAEEEFEKFWELYPKRPSNPKQPAKKSFIKALKDGTPKEDIFEGLAAYAETRRGKNSEYTAMAATWLNQRRWEDDYGPVKEVRRLGNFV